MSNTKDSKQFSITKFTFETAEELYYSTEKYPVDFEIAWKVLGYSRKDSAKRKLTSYFTQDTDYRLHSNVDSAPDGGLTHREDIYLTVECFKEMGMLAKSEEGKQIRKYFLQCEAIAKQSVKIIPQLQQKFAHLNQVIEEQGKAIALLQSQVQNLLPISADFIPPGWDAQVWDSLPPQDKRHFRLMFRRRRFRPGNEVEIKALPAMTSHQIRLIQRAEVERLTGVVSEEEKQRFDALKQQVLKQYRSWGGES